MQLLGPRSPIIIPECLVCLRVPWRCGVHSCGFGHMYNEVVQFHWPETPLRSSYMPALPAVLSFRVTLVCSRLEQLLALSRLSCPPRICRARAWLCGPPHTWAASRSPGVDAGCTLGGRHRRSPHPTSPGQMLPAPGAPSPAPALQWPGEFLGEQQSAC